MKKMFVCTKPIVEPNGELQQHLLGILSQNEKGEYSFQYKLGPNDNGLLLPIFPDKDKIYSDHDTHLLLDDYLPSENDTSFMKEILKKSGMKEYDEWEWLRTFESIDENTSTRLYETLPDNVIVHVDLNDCSNEVETENNEESDFDDNEFEKTKYHILKTNHQMNMDLRILTNQMKQPIQTISTSTKCSRSMKYRYRMKQTMHQTMLS